MSGSNIATVWETFTKGEWVHNHISAGIEDGAFPRAKLQYHNGPPFPDHVKAWGKGTWRKTFMWLDDNGNLIPWEMNG